MRISAPVHFSSSLEMMADVEAGGLKLRKGDIFLISMYNLCMNTEQWIEPKKFLPERFNPESKYYLTPDGKKRSPVSFSPFLGGQRVCLGKTFVTSVLKLVVPTLLWNYEFEFDDGVNADNFEPPYNTIMCLEEPKFYCYLKQKSVN